MYKSNEKKTRICIISEGCYPYVSGGVSSWIQMLLENMEEFEFLICSVVADNEFIGKYKYKFPGNVLKMYNITLDYMENYKGTVEKFPEFNNKMYRTVKGILAGEGFKFKDFYDTFGNFSAGQITGFLLSYEYYNIVKEINRNYFPEVPLNGFWNTRAMLLPLFSLIVQDILQICTIVRQPDIQAYWHA